MVTELSPFYGFHKTFDQLLDGLYAPQNFSRRRGAYPPLNISEDADHVYVECELPGVDPAEVEILLSKGTLSIKGELKPVEGKYYRQERPTGVFQRVVNVNSRIDRDAISASYKDGVLEVKLPKAEEFKPKKITIGA